MSLSLAGDGTITGFDAGLSGFGGLVDVKSALFTGTQTNSTAAGANFAVTDLSITHEVADASNKLIISAFLGAAASTNQVQRLAIAVHDGTSLIAIGDAASSRPRVTAGGAVHRNTGNFPVTMPSVTFVHTPGAGSKTYTVRAINPDPSTETIFINRNERDLTSDIRAVSSLVIQEVSV